MSSSSTSRSSGRNSITSAKRSTVAAMRSTTSSSRLSNDGAVANSAAGAQNANPLAISQTSSSLKSNKSSFEATTKPSPSKSLSRSNASVQPSRPLRSSKSRLRQKMVTCPLCMGEFPTTEIERHASQCLEINAPIEKKKGGSKEEGHESQGNVTANRGHLQRHGNMSKKKKRKSFSETNSAQQSSIKTSGTSSILSAAVPNNPTETSQATHCSQGSKYSASGNNEVEHSPPQQPVHRRKSKKKHVTSMDDSHSKAMESDHQGTKLKKKKQRLKKISSGDIHESEEYNFTEEGDRTESQQKRPKRKWFAEAHENILSSPLKQSYGSNASDTSYILRPKKRRKADDPLVVAHLADEDVQVKFPSYTKNRQKKWKISSGDRAVTLPISSKPYASVHDARSFLKLLKAKCYRNSELELSPLLKFLSYVRLARNGEMSTYQLLSHCKSIFVELEGSLELMKQFEIFLPSLYNMKNVLPKRVSENVDVAIGCARTHVTVAWERSGMKYRNEEDGNQQMVNANQPIASKSEDASANQRQSEHRHEQLENQTHGHYATISQQLNDPKKKEYLKPSLQQDRQTQLQHSTIAQPDAKTPMQHSTVGKSDLSQVQTLSSHSGTQEQLLTWTKEITKQNKPAATSSSPNQGAQMITTPNLEHNNSLKEKSHDALMSQQNVTGTNGTDQLKSAENVVSPYLQSKTPEVAAAHQPSGLAAYQYDTKNVAIKSSSPVNHSYTYISTPSVKIPFSTGTSARNNDSGTVASKVGASSNSTFDPNLLSASHAKKNDPKITAAVLHQSGSKSLAPNNFAFNAMNSPASSKVLFDAKNSATNITNNSKSNADINVMQQLAAATNLTQVSNDKSSPIVDQNMSANQVNMKPSSTTEDKDQQEQQHTKILGHKKMDKKAMMNPLQHLMSSNNNASSMINSLQYPVGNMAMSNAFGQIANISNMMPTPLQHSIGSNAPSQQNPSQQSFSSTDETPRPQTEMAYQLPATIPFPYPISFAGANMFFSTAAKPNMNSSNENAICSDGTAELSNTQIASNLAVGNVGLKRDPIDQSMNLFHPHGGKGALSSTVNFDVESITQKDGKIALSQDSDKGTEQRQSQEAHAQLAPHQKFEHYQRPFSFPAGTTTFAGIMNNHAMQQAISRNIDPSLITQQRFQKSESTSKTSDVAYGNLKSEKSSDDPNEQKKQDASAPLPATKKPPYRQTTGKRKAVSKSSRNSGKNKLLNSKQFSIDKDSTNTISVKKEKPPACSPTVASSMQLPSSIAQSNAKKSAVSQSPTSASSWPVKPSLHPVSSATKDSSESNSKPYDGMTKPEKAKNPFTHFCRMMKPPITAEFSNLPPNVNIKEKVQEETQLRWRALKEEEKQYFVKRSMLDYKRYENEMKIYREVQQRLEQGLLTKDKLG